MTKGTTRPSADGGEIIEGEVDHDFAVTASSVPGRMVGEGDAYGLGVRRSSTVPPAVGSQPLTPYLARAFDTDLRARVANAAEGVSTLVVLGYESPSGASRACWEALHQTVPEGEEMLFNGWWVWPKLSPGTPEELLRFLDGIEPRTVLFLDHLEWYLDADQAGLGEKVVEQLRQLLHDQSRAPVLIMGTMPREHWRWLMECDDAAESRRRSQIRSLLDSADLWMPAELSDDEIAAARTWPDSRMRAAVRHSDKRRVIQRLASAPELERRYRCASAAEQAVLRAAIALRLLGHEDWVPAMLLLDAARAHHPAGGFELGLDIALRELTRPGLAGTSPLIRRGAGAGEYRLDEYVAEIGCRERRAEPTTEELWTSVCHHAAVDQLVILARAARRRHLLLVAASLFGRAFELGDYGAVGELADMLGKAGQVEAAAEHYAVLAEAGDLGAIRQAIDMLLSAKRTKVALEWLDRYCTPDRTELLGIAAQAYAAAGRRDQAIECGRRAAVRGDFEPMMVVAGMLNEERRLDTAIELLTELADSGHRAALSAAVEYLADAGSDDVAQQWLQARIDAGDSNAYLPGAVLLAKSFQMEKCKAWFESARAAGVPGAAGIAAKTFAALKYFELAQQFAERAVKTGEYEAVVEAAVVLAGSGFYSRAATLFQCAADAGHHPALAIAARTFAAIGQVSETRRWFDQARTAGVAPVLDTLIAGLAAAGHQHEAIDWFLDEADTSRQAGLAPIIQVMQYAGRVGAPDPEKEWCLGRDAVNWYRTHTDLGEPEIYHRIGEELFAAGLALKQDARANIPGNDRHDTEASQLQSAGAEWCQYAAKYGCVPASLRAGEMLIVVGRHAQALPLLRTAEERGEVSAVALRALCLARLGNPESFDEINALLRRAHALSAMTEYAAAAAILAGCAPRLDKVPHVEGQDAWAAQQAQEAQDAKAAEVASAARKMGEELLALGMRAGDPESLRQLQRRHLADCKWEKAIELFRKVVERGLCDAKELANGWDAVAVSLSEAERKAFKTYGLTPGGAAAGTWRLAPPDRRSVPRLHANQTPQRQHR
ncbi:hypothetical protein AB5J62_15015 [Amycolatopsis sp. cg5]|uniref:hypothetical protein n=1 Tax=Amycolatopsis sp. cg5 TaxID=3238802 RepID=UPI00352469C5